MAYIWLLILVLSGFFQLNKINYEKQVEIKKDLVKHPENLPTKQTALNTAFGFKNLRADIYWLETIQYIWWNAVSSEYKKYLFTITDLITELNPYFEHPYIVAQLLLPDYNKRYENLSEEEQEIYTNQAIDIWLKWINNFCDLDKINLISNEDNLQLLWSEEKYKNPCKVFNIPYYLGYIYYFYKNDPLEASKYYKVASANEDSLEWSRIMTAIMQWKWGNREKSFFMFLNIAKSIDPSNTSCIVLASKLEQLWAWIFLNQNILLDWKLVKSVEKTRLDTFWEFNEDAKNVLSDSECSNYVNKAVRELNLAYIEHANNIYKKDNNGTSARHAKRLLNKWYIDFLPSDFQQYETYGVIYQFNQDTWNFDYEMGTY